MKIPVAVITDSDVKYYQKNRNNYVKREADTVHQKEQQKIADINEKAEQIVKYFVAPQWTLEYSLYKSTSLTTVFQNSVKAIHTKTDWNADFEKELARKLIDKKLKKTEIAYRIANAIDEDLSKSTRTIQIASDDEDDTINYLVKAIKYAAGN
jgi:putative ATP-dependent endonuclease of OLD family